MVFGSDPMEKRRRAVLRDLAATEALREWRKESRRQMLSDRDCVRCAPPLAVHGRVLEAKQKEQQIQARREEIKAAADRVQKQALRRRGLS